MSGASSTPGFARRDSECGRRIVLLLVLFVGLGLAGIATEAAAAPKQCSVAPATTDISQGESVAFNASWKGGKRPYTVDWTFQDATPATAQTTGVGNERTATESTTFNSPGGKTVSITVTDSRNESCAGTTFVEVQDGVAGNPVGRGDLYATPVDTELNVQASRVSGVLYNDFDTDNNGLPIPDSASSLRAQLVSGPSNGTLTLDETAGDTAGSFIYTPSGLSDNDTDQFTYRAVDPDGNVSAETTVVIQVLSKQVDYKIFMNYELGMHCTGFEFAYCCVLPPYNSIVAQVLKPAQGDPALDFSEDAEFVDGFPRLLEGDPVEGLDILGRETVLRDPELGQGNDFKKYQLRYFHDAQPRQEGNTSKPNASTLISAVEGNSLQYFNTVYDSAAVNPPANICDNTNPDTAGQGCLVDADCDGGTCQANAEHDPGFPEGGLITGTYNNVSGVVLGDGDFDDPTDNYANGWLNHFYIYADLEGSNPGNTSLEADKIRLGVTGQVEYPADSGAALQPMGPTGNGAFENLLTFSTDTGTVVFTQAKVLENLPIMLTSPRIWEALGLPLTPFEDTINFFGDPGAVDEDAIRPYVAMKAQLHEYPSGDAVIGSNGEPVIGFGDAPIDIPNCERCHSAPSTDPDTGLPNVNSPNWVRDADPDATNPASYPHGGPLAGTGLEDMTNLEINFWLAYYDIVPGVDSTWYPRLKGAAINMLTLHDYDIGTEFTINYAGVECTANPDPADPTIDPSSYDCSFFNPAGPLADLDNPTNIPQNTRLGAESVICQKCHADNVVAVVKSAPWDQLVNFPVPPISEALHWNHRNTTENNGPIVFNDSLGRDGGCQGCHPAHRSDGVMDGYPITLGGNNSQADGDNRLAPGGCFVGRDVHSNPLKDVDGAETPSHLTAVGNWLNGDNVAMDSGEDRGIWCTNCHTQLSQEIWKAEDCDDLIRNDCLVNPRGASSLGELATMLGTSQAQVESWLDPKVTNAVDDTHRVWDPSQEDAFAVTAEVDSGGNPVGTFDDDGDFSVNILSFCTTDDCLAQINDPANRTVNATGNWRYPEDGGVDGMKGFTMATGSTGVRFGFNVATDGRDHWLSPGEPHCADCHAAPYTEQSGNINPFPPFNYPAKASLMRYTRGHQDVTCQGCHESIHGLYPVSPTIDSTSYAQAAALNNDGSHGPLKCAACHTHVDALGIPTWVDDLLYTDPITQVASPVEGSFDNAVGFLHTYTQEANPLNDVCLNCHGLDADDLNEISENEKEWLEHAQRNRVSRVAMDAAEIAATGGILGDVADPTTTGLCNSCHNNNNLRVPSSCSKAWKEHLIEGRVAEVVWETVNANQGFADNCGW